MLHPDSLQLMVGTVSQVSSRRFAVQPRMTRESFRHPKQPTSSVSLTETGHVEARDDLKAQAHISLEAVSLQIMQDWVTGSNVDVPDPGVFPDPGVVPASGVVPEPEVVPASGVVTGGGAFVVISWSLQSDSLQVTHSLPEHPTGKSDKHPRST